MYLSNRSSHQLQYILNILQHFTLFDTAPRTRTHAHTYTRTRTHAALPSARYDTPPNSIPEDTAVVRYVRHTLGISPFVDLFSSTIIIVVHDRPKHNPALSTRAALQHQSPQGEAGDQPQRARSDCLCAPPTRIR